MVLTKSIEYFDPVNVKGKCHIIGCGSVGSTVAALLARLGVTKFVLYDFDRVEAHNLANQMFIHKDIKTEKVDAVKRIITEINPDAEPTIEICREGYNDQKLNGYVFLCVDNIDLRREICQKHRMNRMIKAVFDFRTRLEDAQHYAANWADMKQVDNLIKTMDFSHDEAHAATPVTACGTELGVAPTVWVVCSLGVCNFMNLIRGVPLKNIVVCNPFAMDIF
ncbi:MAG: ThiF family adenylyltransferase [Bacteroidaceae bacterium]|nr:ThiF family adenylyltransferase [Bacteroidaceae bacterium]